MIKVTWLHRSAAPLAVAAALGFAVTTASAQQFPTQDIHFFCGFPPGSGADVLVRYFAEKVRPLTGKNIVVENKVGAGGNIAMEHVARSKPDGYNVFVQAGSGAAAFMSLRKEPSIDVAKQIQIAGTINRQPYMIAVLATSPHKTLADLTAAMKAKGEKGSYGSANPSSTITAEFYKQTLGLKTVEVPYRTGQDMVNDLASGQLDFVSSDPVQSLSMQRKGEWRILGISSGERLVATGDLPTLKEQGVPLDLTGWWAAMVPAGTPKPILDTYHKWFAQVVGSEDTKKFLAQFGGDPLIESPEVAQQRLLKDIKAWGDFVRMAKNSANLSGECNDTVVERVLRHDVPDTLSRSVPMTSMILSGANAVTCMPRRSAGLLAIAAAVTLSVASATAQQFPTQDIRFVCGFPPGSGADTLVRYFAEKVRPLAGKSVLVENKVGAAGHIAMEYVARSKPDGYTLLLSGASGVAGSMSLVKKPPIDAATQIQVAGTINRQPYMIVVHATKPHKTLADLTAAIKDKGEKATYGTSNHSSTITVEVYKQAMGVRAVEVNYRTGPDMVNDLASGSLDFAAADPVQALSMQRKGEWRILGISSGERLKATGDLPTLKEQGVPLDLTGWWAAMVPMGTPKPVVDTINQWFTKAVGSEETKAFLGQFGGDPLIETPEAAQARLLKDIKEWAEFVKLAKIVPQG